MKVNVGLYISAIESWYGGFSHLTAIAQCVKAYYCDSVKFTLVLQPGNENAEQYLGDIFDDLIILDRSKAAFLHQIYSMATRSNPWIEKELLRAGVTHLITNSFLSTNFRKVRLIFWVADFQHKYLPHYFSDDQISKRDRLFKKAINRADRLIAMSKSVQNDCMKFFDSNIKNLFVLKTAFDPAFFNQKEGSNLEKFNLPDAFVYVPNQFWQHKNHLLLLRAIQKLKDRGGRISFVFTGLPHDYRCPTHFSTLLQEIARLGIKDYVYLLGMVDRELVYELYRSCRFVLNPSEFEGFGMSALEAKACGKNILLSDIAAHREFAGEGCYFFDPQSCDDLADKIAAVYEKTDAAVCYDYEIEAKAAADRFMEIL
jgi:glycosyltransferase involved in cell wall biosynthesis